MNNNITINITVKRPGFTFQCNEVFNSGITGIFGHSGAGKTTLLQSISGVLTPTSGTIQTQNSILYSKTEKINRPIHKRHIGYVFQEGRLFPHLSISKNILYGTRFLKKRKSSTDFNSVIKLLELKPFLNKYPNDLSGGQRQRVALGRALMSAPDVLLLDEPFSALDQSLRLQIIPLIKKVANQLAIPVLLVSHDLPDILKLTDQLCIIENGKIVTHAPFSELLKHNKIINLLPINEYINTVTLEVKAIDFPHGIVTLNGMGAHNKVNILMEPQRQKYHHGEKIKVFIRPDNIVLSSNKLEQTSFQNQLQGKVISLNSDGAKTLCIIDCGFPLVAEVSKAAERKLNLRIGLKIFCLFKSLSLDSIHV